MKNFSLSTRKDRTPSFEKCTSRMREGVGYKIGF
nr:MAG TPA: hypothetical protein [Caudoviricetes sp.]